MTKNLKIILILLVITFTFVIKDAFAGCDGFYIAGRGGSTKYKIDSSHNVAGYSDYVIDKKRFMASGALGYRYEHFRAELEYVWRRKSKEVLAEITERRFKSHSYMFVVYYDFFPYSWFTPFVDAGVGYTKSKLHTNNFDTGDFSSVKSNEFTWSLGAGISAKITNRLNLDLGYRYYDMGNLDIYNGDTDIENHEFYAGLRYVL